jgi:1,4-alpha-glucan branching enzyme
VQYRWNIFKNIRHAIEQNEGGLDKFAQGEGHHKCAQAEVT